VRYRGHVGDGTHLDAHRLYGPNRRFTPGARTFDDQVNFLNAHRLGSPHGLFSCETCRERRTLARTLEARGAGAGPANSIALLVRNSNNGIVERSIHMYLSGRQRALHFARSRCCSARRSYILSHISSLLTSLPKLSSTFVSGAFQAAAGRGCPSWQAPQEQRAISSQLRDGDRDQRPSFSVL